MAHTQSATVTTTTVEPIDAAFAARVLGISVTATWNVDQRAAVHRGFVAHHVLVFPAASPGAVMDPAAMRTFATYFGEPVAEVNRAKRDGELPEVSHLNSTIKAREDGKELQFHYQPAIRSEDWHTDQSFLEVPAKATLLHAHEVPSYGGATCFCDTTAAYEALPEEMKARLVGLRAAHGYDTPRARYRPAVRTQAEIDDTPDVIHPLLRTHPDSGRKALYLNFNRLDRIIGMQREASDELLDELAAWVAQERFIYRHRWTVGDTVVWDNRCTLHRVDYDSAPGERRIMLRVVTRGERPV